MNYLPAHADRFAYVPNEKSGTVSVIDTASDQVIAEIKAGDKLRGLAAGAHKAPLLFCRGQLVYVGSTFGVDLVIE